MDYQGDGTRSRVGVGDGQGDPLRPISLADDDELAGLPDLGDPPGVDIQASYIGAKRSFGNDFVHGGPVTNENERP